MDSEKNEGEFKNSVKKIIHDSVMTILHNKKLDNDYIGKMSTNVTEKMVSELVLDICANYVKHERNSDKLSNSSRTPKEIDESNLNGNDLIETQSNEFEYVKCPYCSNVHCATRFAIELDKCMYGASSLPRRAASKGSASNSLKPNYNVPGTDDENDETCNSNVDKSKTPKRLKIKKKKEKIKKSKYQKTDNNFRPENEEMDSQSSVNDTKHSCTPSPADSSSTGSSSSKKKDRKKSAKGKQMSK